MCGECGGSGACDVCDGYGELLVDEMECPACEGSGVCTDCYGGEFEPQDSDKTTGEIADNITEAVQ